MRVMGPRTANTTSTGAEHEGHLESTVRDVVDRRGLLHDLAHRFQGEIQKDDIDNGMTPCERSSYPQAGLSPLCKGGVADPFFPKLLPKSAALLKVTSARSNPLTHIENCWISSHLFPRSFHSGLCIADDALGFDRPLS